MNSLKQKLKKLRLPLMFAALVFVILAITVLLVIIGILLLTYLGYIEGKPPIQLPLSIFAISSILIGTALAMIFSRLPLTPIRKIMEATDQIADGNYNVRLYLRGPEEFRTLSEKFNHMAQEIGSVEMLRSDFINNFSHELKTPIVSICGFAKALKWDTLSEEERNEYLDIIIAESERLSDLSANVLYLSKIEQQSILTDKCRFNLSEQIRLVIAILDQKLSEKQLQIRFDCGEVFLTANEEMLRQVWINLLDNAIKFSPEQGEIEVLIARHDGQIVVTVSNQGDEIMPDAAAHIFDKFYQGDLSHTTKGNGLAIVKRVVTLHGGTICLKQSERGRIVFEVCFKA